MSIAYFRSRMLNCSSYLVQNNNCVFMKECFFSFKLQVRNNMSKSFSDFPKYIHSGSVAIKDIMRTGSNCPVMSDCLIQQGEVLASFLRVRKDFVIVTVDGMRNRSEVLSTLMPRMIKLCRRPIL